jgi:nucleoporin GLE1
MSGFVRLYAAITVTPPSGSRRHRTPAVHPHGVEHAWTWLARIANVEPRPDVTATVIGDFLSVAGHALHRTYGRQFVKLVRLLADEYMPKIKAVTQAGSGGPVTRLEGLLRDATAGRLPQPPRNFDRT